MAEANDINYAIALPTFIGSLLSFLASATALVFQVIRPPQRHFRHSLIVNLLVADLIYGLCNTISGAIFLAHGRTPSPLTPPDMACRVSGWFSQSNAQAVDFNILIISVVVLLSITKKDKIAQLDIKWQIALCVAAWIPGIITGTIGLALDSYGYVSGNWCWVRSDRLDLRYGLSHGPRIAIFFVTIGIYTYIYFTLARVFKTIRSMSNTNTARSTAQQAPSTSDNDNDTQKILVAHMVSISHEMHTMPKTPDTPSHNNNFDNEPNPQSRVTVERVANDGTTFQHSRMPKPPNLKKMLLMNGYPLAYIVLWIPGIANRLAESIGSSPPWLTALQSCTQYIGLLNALTYGMSEQMRRGVWKKLKDTGR